jgi:hypothetical protein
MIKLVDTDRMRKGGMTLKSASISFLRELPGSLDGHFGSIIPLNTCNRPVIFHLSYRCFLYWCEKELGTVSIAHRPCPIAKIEVAPSSYFLVRIICLIPQVYRNGICFRNYVCV